MANTIVSNIATFSDIAGGPNQGRLVFARTQSKWWLFYPATKTATTVSCQFSSSADLSSATWSAGTASGAFPNSRAMSSNDQRNEGCLFGNNSTTDFVHVNLCIGSSTANSNGYVEHVRAAFSGSSTITWDSWVETTGFGTASWPAIKGNALGIGTSGFIHNGAMTLNSGADTNVRISTNADTSSSWTNAWGGNAVADSSPTHNVESYALCQLASAAMLCVYDNGAVVDPNCTGLRFQKYTSGTTWPTTSSADVGIGTTTQDKNDWCAVSLGPASQGVSFRVYAFRMDSTTTIKTRYYDSSWNNPTNAVPTYNVGASSFKTGAGIFAATDGWSIWLFAMDSGSNNPIYYIKGSLAQGTISWGTWTLLEAAGSSARNSLSGCQTVENNQINVVWSQVNGSNFDVCVSTLTVCSFAIVQCVNGATFNTGLSVTSQASTWAKPTTAGNQIFLATSFAYASVAPTSFVYPTGMVAFGGYLNNGTTTGMQLAVEKNCAVRAIAAQTLSWTNGSSCASQVMIEVAGVITSGTQDGSTQTATGSSTSPAGGALTTTNANDAVMGFIGQGSTGTTTTPLSAPTGGFSLPVNGTTNGASGIVPKGNCAVAILYDFVSATGTYTPGMTGRNEGWMGATAGFWACGSAAPGASLFVAANLSTGAGGPFFVCPCT